MRRPLTCAVLGLMLFAAALGAQEGLRKGSIKKVDAAKGTLTITADGKDHELRVTPQTRLMGLGDKELAQGLKSAQLRPGAAVFFKAETRDGKDVLAGLKLVGAGARPGEGGPGAIRQGKVKKLDLDNRTLTLTVAGKDQIYLLSEETQVLGGAGKDLKERLSGLREGAEVLFKAGRKDGKDVIVGLKLGGPARPMRPSFDSSKLKPLTEMGPELYQGHKGGLYPDGKNERPAAHEKAGLALAGQVRPLDAAGKPGRDGKIVLLSVGMSNTGQASTGFLKVLQADNHHNPAVLFVNGAQGGMTAARIKDPRDNGSGQRYWAEVDRRLQAAGRTRAQVQAVWIKQANAGPSQGFPAYAKKLQEELAQLAQSLHDLFPNLKLVYLSSRTYGGYARTALNPEPYAFESGLSVRWLIEQQLKGDPALNYDPKKGAVKAPWLSWGPYLWANGTMKRADGFRYDESDFVGDGTHLSPSGMEKVGRLMLQFFRTDTTAQPWFSRQGTARSARLSGGVPAPTQRREE